MFINIYKTCIQSYIKLKDKAPWVWRNYCMLITPMISIFYRAIILTIINYLNIKRTNWIFISWFCLILQQVYRKLALQWTFKFLVYLAFTHEIGIPFVITIHSKNNLLDSISVFHIMDRTYGLPIIRWLKLMNFWRNCILKVIEKVNW